MEGGLTRSDLEQIAEELSEFVAGYNGFLSVARGEVDLVDEETDFPWRSAFLLFAGKGRVEVYRNILASHSYDLDRYTRELIESTDVEVDDWLAARREEVEQELKEAFEFLLESYREGYVQQDSKQLGWCYDDFLEERDLLEFFIIGIEEIFDTTQVSVILFEEDCRVRERIAELGLENYPDEYFPDRISWLPNRFWWHHPPEERIPHPDSLET